MLDKEKLVEQIEDLKLKLNKSEEQVSVLNRKILLESKSAKHRLNSEITKHRQCQRELDHALVEIDRLSALLEVSFFLITWNMFTKREVLLSHLLYILIRY